MFEQYRKKIGALLRKTERYTKTDMVYLAKGGFWLLLTQLTGTVLTLGMSIAYAYFLSPDAYGTYKFVLALTTIIGAFSLTGIGNAMIQATAMRSTSYLQQFFIAGLKWSWPSILIFIGASVYYFTHGEITIASSMLLIAALNPLISNAALYRSFLNGVKNFRLLNRLQTIETVTISAASFLAIYFFESAFALIATYFSVSTIVSLSLFAYVKRVFTRPEETEPDTELLRMSKHWSIVRILSIAATKIDEVLIFHFLGAAQLALYAFAIAIPTQVAGLFKHSYTLALPKFAAANTQTNISKKSMMVFMASIPVTIIYIVCAPFIFSWLFPQYIASIPYSQWFALIILMSGSNLAVAYIDAKREIKTKYKINVVVDIIKIGLLCGLIIPFGIWGAVIGRVLGRVVGYGFSSYYAMKLERQTL